MKAITVLADELGLSGRETQQELMAFLERRWRGKRPVLQGPSLDQEELNQAAYFGVANLRELVEGR